MALTEQELWYSNIVPVVFTRFKAVMRKHLSTDYPKLKIIAPNESFAPSNFPTVWLRLVDMRERGSGLDFGAIEAFTVTLQVDTITLNADDTERIRNYAIKVLHDIGFSAFSITPVMRDGNKWNGYARFRRLVQESDMTFTE